MLYSESDRVVKSKASKSLAESWGHHTPEGCPIWTSSWGFNDSVRMEDEALDPVRGWELKLGSLDKADVGSELFLP